MYDALHNALHSLQTASGNGFEGLSQAHIGRLTGRSFFLAKSGAQCGKDSSTAGYGATYIDIECKKYRQGKSPRTRELIGFLDEGALIEGLCHELDGRTGFLKDVATYARERLGRNQRARAWFAQFLARRDPVEAWAAFRLFLRCVDRRFGLWGDAMRNATLDLPRLWQHQVNINDQDISRAAGKNEGKLSESLFGLQISKNEMAPWYRTPPMANTS
jgi:hypothetical protein